LGFLTLSFDFDQARTAAEAWFRTRQTGVTDEVVTVEDACRAYVIDRRREKDEATAHDADMRFRRTVYETAFGRRPLVKLRAEHVKVWREGLDLSPAASNRTLVALKAALNLVVTNCQVSAAQAMEWKSVKPAKGADRRRDLCLDLSQRRALLAASEGAVRDLIEAVMATGAPAGELVKATRSQFDGRSGSMTFIGKTGTRTVPLGPQAFALFKRLAQSKLPNARLLVRDDGQAWQHSDWDQMVRAAAATAKLPKGVCLHTLRHSFITQALTDGLAT
jgi:integrase